MNKIIDNIDFIAHSPGGVALLRKLVLELAVQGKLVSQDPKDEPASVLLEQIKREKARLAKEGKIRAGKKPPEIEDEEKPFKLPKGWVWINLGDNSTQSSGKTPSMNKKEYWDNGTIPWITSKDMKRDELSTSEIKVTSQAITDGLIVHEIGTVLIVVRSGILKRTIPVATIKAPATINQDLKAIRPFHPSLTKWIPLLIKGFESEILQHFVKGGMTVQSLDFDRLMAQAFPLPPLAEQTRIVARVQELMAILDRLEEKLAARDKMAVLASESIVKMNQV